MTDHPSATREALDDVRAVSARLRDTLPTVVISAGRDDAWPDTLLADAILGLAESIARLGAAADLLADEPG